MGDAFSVPFILSWFIANGFVQKLEIARLFLFRQDGIKKVFCAVLDRKQAFLDFKNINFMKVAKLTFFQRG